MPPKMSSLQDAFQPIPGLISRSGVTKEMGTATACSQVAGLIHMGGSSKGSSLHGPESMLMSAWTSSKTITASQGKIIMPESAPESPLSK